MNFLIPILLFLIGLVLIVKGGDAFVDAAAWMAEVSGVPKFVVGATIVSLATTLPELFVSGIAASQGKVDMALGNAIGSVSANTGLIFALSVLFIPAVAKRSAFLPKGTLFLVVILAVWWGCRTGEMGITGAVVLLILLALFLAENLHSGRIASQSEPRQEYHKEDLRPNLIKFVLGAASIVVGSQLLVDNGSTLASAMGISEKVISLTAISIGTSLPELVTTLSAIRRKESSLSVGNIIGANIIDMTLVLPVCTLVSGGSLPVSASSLTTDLPVCLLIAVIAIIPTLVTEKLQRWQGALGLLVYLAYLLFLCV
jgi:cation:H+ antiporter